MKKASILLSVLSALFISSICADNCSNYKFSNHATFKSCLTLPVLNSSLYWNFDPSTRKLDAVHRHTAIISTSNWIAWAINPTGKGMLGSEALVAYQNSNGTMRVFTSPITSYSPTLAPGELSFPVSNLSATYANNEVIIFGTIELPRSMNTTVNIVWQEGQMSGGSPLMHATFGDNIRSMDTIVFLS